MRRGSRSGPSDETTNATSTFAASVCAVVGQAGRVADDRAAARQHARGSVRRRGRPSRRRRRRGRRAAACRAGGSGRVAGFRPDVERAAVSGRDAARHETGLQVFGELVVPAELAQIESRQRKAPSSRVGTPQRVPWKERPALRSGRPRRQKAQSFVRASSRRGTDESSVGARADRRQAAARSTARAVVHWRNAQQSVGIPRDAQ